MSIWSISRRAVTSVLVPSAGALLAIALKRNDLPSELAVHWNTSGEPDNFVSPTTAAGALLGLVALVGALSIAFASRTAASAPGGRWGPAVLDATTWGMAGLVTASIVAQRPGQQPPTLQGSWFLVALGCAAAGVGVSLTTTRGRTASTPPRSGRPPRDAPRLPSTPTGHTWWVGRAPAGGWTIAIAFGIAALGLVLGWTTTWWIGVLLLAAAFLTLSAGSADVTVGSERVVIATGITGWPRIRVDLDSVSSAGVTAVRALRWGIGLRIRPGATAWVTRTGEALELRRTDGARVLVTVDDAEDAAATVNSILDRIS